MCDALRKRHDTVMQYVCVKPPTSGFVPPFSFWMRSTDAPKDTVFSYLAVSGIYFSIAIAHKYQQKARQKQLRKNVESRSIPMLLPFECSSLSCGKQTARLCDRAVANSPEKMRFVRKRTRKSI